ncbi:MAG TPA: cytochrome c [Terriglobales bacterium]|nr:cytochrome c [Terriglobales bacterium]
MAWLGAGLLLGLVAGCRQDMQNQPHMIPLRESTFYADTRSARPRVEGTVARGELQEDAYLSTGKIGGKDGDLFPFPVTREVMQRGRERYQIYCSPCHSELGDGNGMIVQRGLRHPPDYTIPRLMNAPVGHFFDVITNGFGAMPDYREQVPVRDRWAIIAYIRALQLARHAPLSDVPASARPKLGQPMPAPSPEGVEPQ